jgi:hypothetical protein
MLEEVIFMVTECFKCGRPLINGLCTGCHNAPKDCTCEEEIEEEEAEET